MIEFLKPFVHNGQVSSDIAFILMTGYKDCGSNNMYLRKKSGAERREINRQKRESKQRKMEEALIR